MNTEPAGKRNPPVYGAPERVARVALLSFVLTFLASRIVVVLIMARQIPNLFFFLHGTHVHHLNYGIFLLSIVGGYLLFRRPQGMAAERAAIAYGISMALTFDEFGMWLHLGGSYWQRASVDAVIVVGAVLGLIAFAPSLRRFEVKHLWGAIILGLAVAAFGYVLVLAGNEVGHLVGPKLHELELQSSP
ncbi:MAG: hypothetical protein ACXWJB_14700 [Limisphaerales bacterium]